jgi:hypothetical protein
MFEYHCWAVVQADGMEAERELVQELEERIAELSESSRKTFHLTYLNEVHVVASGLRNHAETEVIDVFHWLAERSPRSYGLLYIRNEHVEPDGTWRFEVQKLSRGRIEYLEDRYLADQA